MKALMSLGALIGVAGLLLLELYDECHGNGYPEVLAGNWFLDFLDGLSQISRLSSYSIQRACNVWDSRTRHSLYVDIRE